MKKDVIYIDIEDDITSIIEKVKSSGEKIIALVPPKRAGILQSAVNLKLLHRAASSADRHLVLITSDKALSSLAAGVQIPVAKTLQSRPELATALNVPDTSDDDIIKGDELPVGELAQKTAPPASKANPDDIIQPANIDGKEPKSVAPAKPPKKGSNVPNFDRFRKKLFFIIGGIVLLIIFLIWATIFAPHALVNIKAKTSAVEVALPVTLNPSAATTPEQALIKPLVQQVKKTNSADFTATGKKDVGSKASGTVTVNNCGDSDPISIPAGTAVSSDGLNFFTASSVGVPGGKFNITGCTRPGQASVAVSAQDVGEQYNLDKNSIFTVAGQNPGVSAVNPNPISGGSKRQITVISDNDIASAQQKITNQDQSALRQELASKFDPKNTIVVADSFTASPGSPNVTPPSGSEASGGRVTIETTYTLFAIAKPDAAKTLEAVLKTKIKDDKTQRVYDNGLNKLQLTKYASAESGGTLQFVTTGFTGPTINTQKLKPDLVNKNYEEIRQKIKTVNGVDDVDTKFSPFWVSKVNDAKKIDIKFSVSKK